MDSINALIADDHQLFREGMESLLRKLPHITNVFHADNGSDAVKMVEKNKVDLIFMDIRMPKQSGIEATRKIRQSGNGVNIIALTMMEDPHSVVSMFRAGADGYLLKNTSFTELQDAIKTVMSGERYYSKDVSQILMDRMIDSAKPRPNKIEKVILTDREKEVVALICQGFTNKDLSEILNISVKTVETHRHNVYAKLNISNSADLVYYAVQEGIMRGGR